RPTLAELARRNARREHVADPTEERRISDLHVQSSRRRATHYAGGVERAIVGYHQDEHGDWVAELACGHQRHVRHRPPFQLRPWVVEAEGRRQRVGTPLECGLCEANVPAPPAPADAGGAAAR